MRCGVFGSAVTSGWPGLDQTKFNAETAERNPREALRPRRALRSNLCDFIPPGCAALMTTRWSILKLRHCP